jgi:hypothetical protein
MVCIGEPRPTESATPPKTLISQSTLQPLLDKFNRFVKDEPLMIPIIGLLQALAYLFGCTVVVAIGMGVYQWLDQSGYIHHDRTIDVYMSSNWLVGENRICSLVVRKDANEKPKLDSLQCPIGDGKLDPHNITVTFKGPIDPVDTFGKLQAVADQWSCKRGDDKFTCVPMATPAKPTN